MKSEIPYFIMLDFVYVRVCACVHMHICMCSQKLGEAVRYPRTRVSGSWKLMGAENQTGSSGNAATAITRPFYLPPENVVI